MKWRNLSMSAFTSMTFFFYQSEAHLYVALIFRHAESWSNMICTMDIKQVGKLVKSREWENPAGFHEDFYFWMYKDDEKVPNFI